MDTRMLVLYIYVKKECCFYRLKKKHILIERRLSFTTRGQSTSSNMNIPSIIHIVITCVMTCMRLIVWLITDQPYALHQACFRTNWPFFCLVACFINFIRILICLTQWHRRIWIQQCKTLLGSDSTVATVLWYQVYQILNLKYLILINIGGRPTR